MAFGGVVRGKRGGGRTGCNAWLDDSVEREEG